MTRLLGSVRVHMVSALYRILTGSFCRLTLYGLSLPVGTRNALQNELTMPWHPCSVECTCTCILLDVIFGDYCDKQFFLQADSLQTLLPSVENTWINYLANGYGSVITCTMVDGNLSLLYSLFDSQYYRCPCTLL